MEPPLQAVTLQRAGGEAVDRPRARSSWTTLIDDERGCLKLEINRAARRVFVHLSLKQWNTDVLRAIKDGLPVLKGTLRAVGFRRVSVIIPEGDEKLYRFERLFGFSEINRRDGHILMEQDC